jgi:hypothetical protein
MFLNLTYFYKCKYGTGTDVYHLTDVVIRYRYHIRIYGTVPVRYGTVIWYSAKSVPVQIPVGI